MLVDCAAITWAGNSFQSLTVHTKNEDCWYLLCLISYNYYISKNIAFEDSFSCDYCSWKRHLPYIYNSMCLHDKNIFLLQCHQIFSISISYNCLIHKYCVSYKWLKSTNWQTKFINCSSNIIKLPMLLYHFIFYFNIGLINTYASVSESVS